MLKRRTRARFELLDKEELVTFICGLSVYNFTSSKLEPLHQYIDFTGNQWNDSYEWNLPELSKLSKEELLSLIEKVYDSP